MEKLVMFDLKIFLASLGVFIMLTFLPYFMCKLTKADVHYEKFVARNWFAVVFPSVLALYMVLIDGMDVLQADVTQTVMIWSVIQGVIFSLTESAQKIVFRKGDWQVNVITKHDKKGSTEEDKNNKKDEKDETK